MEVDRRAEYYAKVAPVIAADPLDFYCRAAIGRQFQATIKNPTLRRPFKPVLVYSREPKRGCV